MVSSNSSHGRKRGIECSPENIDMKETCFKVLGKDITIPISVAMTENTTVHCEWSDKVLRTLAPVRTWKPISRILLARSMKPVHSYAILVLPKISYPKSPV